MGSGPAGSGLGAALTVGVRPRRAGVRVRLLVVVLVFCQVLLPYPPAGGAEPGLQPLVVKAAALLSERVLGRDK